MNIKNIDIENMSESLGSDVAHLRPIFDPETSIDSVCHVEIALGIYNRASPHGRLKGKALGVITDLCRNEMSSITKPEDAFDLYINTPLNRTIREEVFDFFLTLLSDADMCWEYLTDFWNSRDNGKISRRARKVFQRLLELENDPLRIWHMFEFAEDEGDCQNEALEKLASLFPKKNNVEPLVMKISDDVLLGKVQ